MKFFKSLLCTVLTVLLVFGGVGCENYSGTISGQDDEDYYNSSVENLNVSNLNIGDEELNILVEGAVYDRLERDGDIIVHSINTVYISQEYIDELTYNSLSNIYYGYNIDAVLEAFQDTAFTFTCNDSGQTIVTEVQPQNDMLAKVLKDVAIGTGVILVCAVISVASAGAGAAPCACFFASCAKTGAIMALEGAATGAIISGVVGGIQTQSWDGALDSAFLGAADGYKWGAIIGCVSGGFAANSCFVGETLVHTEQGYMQIQDIKIGDYVYSYDEVTETYSYEKVVDVYTNTVDSRIQMYTVNGSICSTLEHPFLTDEGWKAASKLAVGDKIHRSDGNYDQVVCIEVIDEVVEVFNLNVSNNHTFTVTENEYVVHNRCNANSKYAGKTYKINDAKYPELAAKYPKGVQFTDDAFPRFEPYVYKKGNRGGIVTLDYPSKAGVAKGTCFTGNYAHDAALANKLSGFGTTASATPAGYVWHHVEDMQTLILIPQDIHQVVRHTGGASLIKALLKGL